MRGVASSADLFVFHSHALWKDFPCAALPGLRHRSSLIALATLPLLTSPVSGETPRPTTAGTLLFEDSFERDEPTADKEEIGPGWRSNSAWRAAGEKQVDLDNGAMHITRHPKADHGVAIFHDVAFQDGVVQLRFKLRPGDDLGIDFVDREEKTIHAGHLCLARVTTKGITLIDSKTGHMRLDIRERRRAGEKSPELTELINRKRKVFPRKIEPETWYTLRVEVEGDVMRAFLNDEFVGQFQSEGIGHPTKRMITLAINKSAWVDDVKVWKLK